MPAVAVINEMVKIDAIIETREIMAAPKRLWVSDVRS